MLPEAGADTGADRSDGAAGYKPPAIQDVPDVQDVRDAPDTQAPDGNDSSVTIGVSINSCPTIVAVTASPPMARVVAPITVTVAAHDPDPGDHLTYAWSAPAGSFVSPGNAGTMYTCAAPGPQTLTVAVSDGQCTQMTTLTITCTQPDAGAGGA